MRLFVSSLRMFMSVAVVLACFQDLYGIPPSRDNRRFPAIMAAQCDPESRYVAVAEWRDWGKKTGLVRFFDLTSGRELHPIPEHDDGNPRSLSISGNGQYLAATTFPRDGVRVWDMRTKTKITGIFEASEALSFSPNGKELILGSPNSRIFAYSVPEWKKLGEFERTFTRTPNADFSNVKSVHVSPDGKFLAAAHNGVRIWDTRTRREMQVPYAPTEWFITVEFSPDSKLLVCVNRKGLYCWDVERKKQAWQRDGSFQAVAWTPDGKDLIASSYHEGVHYVNPKNGWTRELLYARPFWASALAFSPDGQWLVAGGQMEIRVRNLKTGKDHIIKQEPYIEK